MIGLNDVLNHDWFDRRESEYIRWYPKTLTGTDTGGFRSNNTLKPNGVYVHVPFCDKICSFCPYNKRLTDITLLDRYMEALLTEIRLYGARSEPTGLEFVYFGGGTPSTLAPSKIERIVAEVESVFGLRDGAEVSVEAHPTHLSDQYAADLKACGVTRVSSGLQSFDDNILKQMGAHHTAQQAHNAIENVGKHFESIAIDLIYRCQGQTIEMWSDDLNTALEHECVDHLSLYSLILEKGGEQPSIEEDISMAIRTFELLHASGFENYASCASGGFDFARPGSRGVYEERHWGAPQAEFLGLGPGAIGFVDSTVTVNALALKTYCERLESGNLATVSHTVADRDEMMRRYFVLGVKTMDVDLDLFKARFGVDARNIFSAEFERLIKNNMATLEGRYLKVTDLGRLFVDSISTIFFSDFEKAVPHPEEPEIRAVERQLVQVA